MCRVCCVSFYVKPNALGANMTTEKKHNLPLVLSVFISILFFFVFSHPSFDRSPSPSIPLTDTHTHAHHICYGGKNMLASSFYFGVQSPISVV